MVQASDSTIAAKVQHLNNGDAMVAKSGGQVVIETGGTLSVGGVDVSTSVKNGVAGTSSGTKVIGGEVALDGSNPTPVTTGLTTITGAVITLKESTAPGVGTSVFSYTTSGGTLSIYAWKPTSNADPTLIASTGTETVGYVVTGT